MRALVIAVALVSLWSASADAQSKLPDIVQRASAYVDNFVSRFSSVVAEETYVQREERPHRTRELRSDFLLVKPPGQASWFQFRDVIEVDGKPVGDREQRLASLFLEAAPNALASAERVTRESARYNLEDVGTLNKPLIAISFLQGLYVSRFWFTIGPIDRSVGPNVRLIQFTEWVTPTILRRGTANGDLKTRGRVWIDETSGRVAKTELDFGADPDPSYVITTFRFDDDLHVDVPVEMRERWRFRDSEVTGVASYGRFRQFNVQTNEQLR